MCARSVCSIRVFDVYIFFLSYNIRHLGSELVEIENAIERMMENDFVNFLMEGVKQRVGSQEKLSDQDEQTTEV